MANKVPNSHSRPSTPDILVTGVRRTPHYSIPDLKFGDVCMVQQIPIKRVVEAKANDVPLKNVPDAKIGVCLGYSPEVPGAYCFVLANGQVRVAGLCHVNPFDWRPKKVYKADLAMPYVEPRRMGQALIQQPDASVFLDSVNSIPSDLKLPEHVPVSYVESSSPLAPLSSDAVILLSTNDVVEPFVESIASVDSASVLESSVLLDEVSSVVASPQSPEVSYSVPTSVMSSPVHATNHYGRSISKPIGFWAKQPVAKQAVVDDGITVDDEWVVPSRTVKRVVAQAAYLSTILLNLPVFTSVPAEMSPLKLSPVRHVGSVKISPKLSCVSVVSDALTLDERMLLQDIIDDNRVYAAAADVANCSWYDISTVDDLSLEECCDYIKSPVAYAARVSSDQLCPVPIIKCKEMGLYRAFKAVYMDR
jgi:hypothetical protein